MAQFCEFCGTSLKPEWKVCTKCGRTIGEKLINSNQDVYSPEQQLPLPPNPYYKNPRNNDSLLSNIKILLIIQMLCLGALVGFIFVADIVYVELLGTAIIIMTPGTFYIIVLLSILGLILSIITFFSFNKKINS